MKSLFCLLFTSSLLFISCKKELEPQDSSTPSQIVPFTESANIPQNQSVMQDQALQNQNTTTQTTTTTTTPVVVAKGMNPAHGQPGHRCDIQVGAPLNSPVAKPQTTPVVQQQNVVSTTVTPSVPATLATPETSSVTTPEGMNPPHGQAGHRCDIAVGAALPKE